MDMHILKTGFRYASVSEFGILLMPFRSLEHKMKIIGTVVRLFLAYETQGTCSNCSDKKGAIRSK